MIIVEGKSRLLHRLGIVLGGFFFLLVPIFVLALVFPRTPDIDRNIRKPAPAIAARVPAPLPIATVPPTNSARPAVLLASLVIVLGTFARRPWRYFSRNVQFAMTSQGLFFPAQPGSFRGRLIDWNAVDSMFEIADHPGINGNSLAIRITKWMRGDAQIFVTTLKPSQPVFGSAGRWQRMQYRMHESSSRQFTQALPQPAIAEMLYVSKKLTPAAVETVRTAARDPEFRAKYCGDETLYLLDAGESGRPLFPVAPPEIAQKQLPSLTRATTAPSMRIVASESPVAEAAQPDAPLYTLVIRPALIVSVGRNFLVSLLLIAVMVGWLFVSIRYRFVRNPFLRYGAILCIVYLTLFIPRLISAALTRRRVAREASGPESVQQIASKLIARRTLAQPIVRIAAMVKTLAASNRTGETIVICETKDIPLVTPILHPFEPRLLDQADSAFAEMHAAATAEAAPATAPVRLATDDLGLGRVKRNLALRGGPARLIAPLMLFALAANTAYQRRTITPSLVFWSMALVVILFLPVFTRSSWGIRWLAVQGGLILRKSAGLFGGQSQVMLFDRRSSVLCILSDVRGKWRIAVADAARSYHANITRQEADFALRAWLSPLPPPPLEHVQELA